MSSQNLSRIIIGFFVVSLVIAAIRINFPSLLIPPKNRESQPTFEDTLKEERASFENEIKENVSALCEDNPKSQMCQDAIDRCFKNQSCQNMVTAYQLAKKGTPELDDQAFINASKEFVNLERAQLGLPPVK